MQKSKDFANMTLDELTPIVSMRPGKEYTKEELRAARAAFMAALESTEDAPSAPAEEETAAVPAKEEPAEGTASDEPAQTVIEAPAVTEEVIPEETAEIPQAPAEEAPAFSAPSSVTREILLPDFSEPTVFPAEDTAETAAEIAAFAVPQPEAEVPVIEKNEPEAKEPSQDEEFILRTESRLARFLYILYAYLLVPLLAAEALVFLIASVATAMAVPHIPYVILHIFCAALYTMIVSVAWHQFLHRTQFGLLLNRALIAVCIFRGINMLLSGESLFSGIIFVALSALFLVFFVGYDSTFVIHSPKRRHAR